MEMILNTLLRIALLFSLCLSSLAFGQSSGWLSSPQHPPAQVRLMLTGELDADSKRLPAVLQVKLADDWKTYWRSPGEGGIAPSISWQGSTNFESAEWFWPVPERFSLLGLQTYGYQQNVDFPLLLTLNSLTEATTLRGVLTLSTCTNVCVLTDYPFSLAFTPTKLRVDSEAMYFYNKAKVAVPLVLDGSASEFIWDASQQRLQVNLVSDAPWQQLQVVVDGDPDTTFKLLNLEPQSDGLSAFFSAENWLGEPQLLNKTLSLTVFDKQQAFEYQAEVRAGSVVLESVSWLKLLVFALLGGLILNIMPCVLPVLGMKLSSVIAAPHQQQGTIRRQFMASAAGIVVSFWLLAGFVLLLKFSGQAVGWGVQFQQPWFIAFMVLVTSLFAFNMLGAFEISLPSTWQTRLASIGGNGYVGHFLQGMFATLLATPCSAPFLGTAVAFALGADSASLVVVFTALAIGMALPWLLVATFPKLAQVLPKPGKWMGLVKLIFSLMLFATSLWLVSLLANFVAMPIVLSLIAVLVLLFILFVAKQHGAKVLLISLSAMVLLGGGIALIGAMTSEQWAKALPTDLVWQPLQHSNIQQQVAQGKVVFVDVTADWCITCKANKVGVTLQDPTYSLLKQPSTLLVKGDWTKPSAVVSEFLQSYQRFGVPFNIVYGPAAPEGITLPVILSHQAIEQAFAQAAGAAGLIQE
ncbi:protein-disulfide reductase DsbD family protein [Agarivorans sp. TSD2052]|uniref:protein-disulfide reductase DsbD family protein n=1 Tax=Agarivorans sp. TSD2052 TaxID=2937286 RepID=UPI003531F1F5